MVFKFINLKKEDKIRQDNVRIVKDLFAALGGVDKQALLALAAEDIEWITPGEDSPLAGKRRGYAGLLDLVQNLTSLRDFTYNFFNSK
jgi:ketosteroid isomerase-like protein